MDGDAAAREQAADAARRGRTGDGFFQGRPSPDGYPVSHAQRQIWTVNQMAAAAGAFNIPLAMALTGALAAAALRSALGTIIRHHESLRTRFAPVAFFSLSR